MSRKIQKLVKVTLVYDDGTNECLCNDDAKIWLEEINQAIILLHMNVKNYEFPAFSWIPGKEKQIVKKTNAKRTPL
jgi:hypothetical protein